MGNYCTVQHGRPQTTIWRMRIACYKHTHTLTICNNYRFSITPMVSRKYVVYVLHIGILPVLLATNMNQIHQLPSPHRVSVSRVVIIQVVTKVRFEYLHLVHSKIFTLESMCLTTSNIILPPLHQSQCNLYPSDIPPELYHARFPRVVYALVSILTL